MMAIPKRSSCWYKKIVAFSFILVAIIACSIPNVVTGDDGTQQPIPMGDSSGDSGEAQGTSTDSTGDDEDEPGFTISLSDGVAQPADFVPLSVTVGEPLPEEDIQRILARLPELVAEDDDAVDFKLPDEVIPPPLTGETIPETFPPDEELQPDVIDAGPLEVLRYAPEGEIPIAPFVNVTFNQPMVPLGTLQDLSELDIPVQIEPALEGTWRWLGTKTLNFQFDSELIDRLPMATEYTVTVSAGTTSAIGGVLEQTVQFKFSTPRPTLQRYYPNSGNPQPLDPIFFVSFDQRIGPAAVLETIQVTADGEPVQVRLATEEEISERPEISYYVDAAGESRWLAFLSDELLPADAFISLVIGPGTPSAEGPLVTELSQSYSFRTYAPLEITDHGCTWWDQDCRPLQPLFIEFNNPIDPAYYEEGMLTIVPELPGAVINILGNMIEIRGMTQGQTTYKVTVDGDIRDVFGQTLGEDEQLRFKIDSAEPFLIGPDDIFVTLDPSASDPILSLYTMNYNRLKVKVYVVEPDEWPDFMAYLRSYYETDKPIDPPGRKLVDKTQRLDADSDVLTEVGIDLSEVIEGEFGHFVVIVEPPSGLFQADRYWETVHAWVQVTQIGLDAFADHSEMVVWASALQDGAPLSGVSITSDAADVEAGAFGALTGENGIAKFEIPVSGATYLVASLGEDQALLPRSTYYWGGDSWYRRTVYDDLRWYVFDDRQMYKPGEEVHLKGWLRRVGGKQDGDVGLVGDSVSSVNYMLTGPQGNEIASGAAEVNALGGFDFAITLPDNTNLGYAQLQLYALGNLDNLTSTEYYHSLQIQEFRRPEFEVSARNETTAPYFVGEHAIVAVEAAYFAGGPLPNAETTWWVTSTPTNYAPPNWSEFSFGFWTPWWYTEGGYDSSSSESFSGVTDAAGEHYLRIDFEGSGDKRPQSIFAESSVMDVNRQAWNSATSLMVHPSNLYVGLRSERYFVERGDPLNIDLIVADLDGEAVSDTPISVTAARLEWIYREGRWHQDEVEIQDCDLISTFEPVTCTFDTAIGGRYQVTAIVIDELGRENMSRVTRWVSGGQRPPSREVEQENVTLIPDNDTYQPGDVAEILVQSPFSPAEGLLTVNRSGILYTERFLIEDGTYTLRVPIEDVHIPNLNIQVDLVGSAPRLDDLGEEVPDAPSRPAYATGYLNLPIPPLQRTLALEVTPEVTELEPGGETTVTVILKDATDNPVSGAELVVVIVDEAILALTNYQLTDPVSVFYGNRYADQSNLYGRASIILTDPLALAEAARSGQELVASDLVEKEAGAVFEGAVEELSMEAPAAPAEESMDMDNGRGAGEAEGAPITVRSDFNPLATFAPEVRTDSNGQAVVKISLPDNLTRYRVMIVAVDSDGSQFGSGEANLTARLPLMVRPSAPRFLNFGDSFELPVVLQNQTDEEMTVDVVVQTTNIELTRGAGQRVTVPANDRVEVRFPSSTENAGTARFQIAAVSGDDGNGAYADAAEVELPVYTPATTEAFATYGVVDEGVIAQPVLPPSDVYPQFGGLEIQTSSTALQALTDAVIYLVAYPYECSEQLSSRILGVAALRDVLTAFEAEGLPSPEDMETRVQLDIERLGGMQNWDGGFPYWRRGQDSNPFNTIHVAHAMARAISKGFDVPDQMSLNVLYYLQDIENHYPWWYSQRTRWILSSYALYVRDLMDDPDPVKANGLYHEAGLEGLSLEAVGWIWQVMLNDPDNATELDEIRTFIGNRVVETAGAANFTTYYDDQSYLLLSSNRRTDAVLLDAMIADDTSTGSVQDQDLIPKLVNGLLAHRVRGHWKNTQENVFVLLALDRYFNTYESQTPDFVARIWLGETYAGSHTYEGYTTERHETQIPMSYLVESDDPSAGSGQAQDLVLSKDGVGRLYYRLGLKYAPTDLWLDPLDMGFVVQREYEAVDDPEDVWRDDDGVWHIRAGARVRVRITMVADNRRYHVALVDPLPAGLEIVNPALAVSGTIPQDTESSDYQRGWWWWGTWYEHQNMRDERAE
ncbi:MAG: hypothetical protein H8D34_02205, partial [Chloroflexi bacterium]|nr:hypothetical protein [Chloroflexota bacterium]